MRAGATQGSPGLVPDSMRCGRRYNPPSNSRSRRVLSRRALLVAFLPRATRGGHVDGRFHVARVACRCTGSWEHLRPCGTRVPRRPDGLRRYLVQQGRSGACGHASDDRLTLGRSLRRAGLRGGWHHPTASVASSVNSTGCPDAAVPSSSVLVVQPHRRFTAQEFPQSRNSI